MKRKYPGKDKCDTLREIRRKIAEANDIPYETEECDYEGPCFGTCPKCDAEIAYLNRELQKKMDRDDEINLAGIGVRDLDAYQDVINDIHLKKESGGGKDPDELVEGRVEPFMPEFDGSEFPDEDDAGTDWGYIEEDLAGRCRPG